MDFNSTTMENSMIICRACLKEGQQQHHMYNLFTLDIIVRRWLQDSTLQNPASEDLYPKYICDDCFNKLDSFQQFYQMCEQSRELYSEIIKKVPMSGNKLNVGKNRLDINAVTGDELQVYGNNDDDLDDNEANIDWLEFDFVAAPITIASSYTKQHGSKQDSQAVVDGILPTTSARTSQGNKSVKKNAKRAYEEISTSQKAPPAQHICEECGQVFAKFASLKEHQFTHKPDHEHPYFCNQCNKIFKNRRTFTDHQMRHAGIKNFECPYCGLKKTTKYELQAHINYHTKERQWLCPRCPLVFNSTRNLRSHDQVVHQRLKRYKCESCEKAFGKPDALKQHIMTHTGEKPHGCLECGKRFAQLVSLKTHMLKTHAPVA